MKFWDSSAIVPLCILEEQSDTVRKILSADGAMIAWWGTGIECASAFARLRREGVLTNGQEDGARAVLAVVSESWAEMLPCEEIKSICGRLLLGHPLRAADSQQLSAAILWADKNPSGHHFVCLDARLREAARKEGFAVLPENL